MFQSQKRKEEIQQLEQKLGERQELIREIAKLESETTVHVNLVEDCQAGIKDHLENTSKYINKIFDSEQSIITDQKDILDEMKLLMDKTQALKELPIVPVEKEGQETRENEEDLCDEFKIKEYSSEAVEETDKIRAVMENMNQYSSQMSMLSLNAAIEAGRMGDKGRTFVNAAEEVRKLAGQYQEMSVELLSQMERLTDRVNQLETQAVKINAAFENERKEREVSARKVAKEMSMLKESVQKEVGDNVRNTADKLDQVMNKNHKIMDDMWTLLSEVEELGQTIDHTQNEIKGIKEVRQKIETRLQS